MIALVCDVILQGRVSKESCDFIGRIPAREVIILPSLVVKGIFSVKIK